MTELFERSAPTQWGPIDSAAGPHRRVFVQSLRTLLDKRKLREPRYGYEAVAKAAFASESTICRVMNGKQLPSIELTFLIVQAITGKLPTNKLIEQWHKAARERQPKKPKDYFAAKIGKQFEAEARKKERQDQGGVLAHRRRILGSAWGPRGAWAVVTGAAAAVLVIVAYVFTDRAWLAVTAAVPGVVAVGILTGALPAQLTSTVVAVLVRLVAHHDPERERTGRIRSRHDDAD
jgi:hypothetical protein